GFAIACCPGCAGTAGIVTELRVTECDSGPSARAGGDFLNLTFKGDILTIEGLRPLSSLPSRRNDGCKAEVSPVAEGSGRRADVEVLKIRIKASPVRMKRIAQSVAARDVIDKLAGARARYVKRCRDGGLNCALRTGCGQVIVI